MQINWPDIPQGSGTGSTYTSFDQYTWIWDGQKWDGLFGNTSGGFLNPWIIFSSLGVPTAYQTLALAMNAAVSGQTIHLYGNAFESSVGINLKDGVDINFNGNVYTLDNDPGNSSATFQNTSTTISCKMYNGTVIRDSGAPSMTLIDSGVVTSSFEFYGMIFKNTNGICGSFVGSVKGGSFYSNNTAALYLSPSPLGASAANIVIKDVYAEGSLCAGIYINNISTIATNYTFTNMVGVSKVPSGSTPTSLHIGIRIMTFFGKFDLIDCIGYSESTVGYGISSLVTASNAITLNGCYGVSTGTGIRTNSANLYNCIAEGDTDPAVNGISTKAAFYSGGTSNYYGCSDSQAFGTYTVFQPSTQGQPNANGFGLALLSGFDRNIENCSFFNNRGIVGISSSNDNSPHTINIKNSTIRSNSIASIDFNYLNLATYNIIGNSVKGGNPIKITGASGGDINNNTLISFDFSSSAITTFGAAGGTSQNVARNTCLDCQISFSSAGVIQKLTSTLSTKGNLLY